MKPRFHKLLASRAMTYCTKGPLSEPLANMCEGLEPGKKLSVERTISEDDVLRFAELTGDRNPIHVESSVRIVHGALLNGLLSGVLGTKLPGPGTIVVQQTIRYPKPCYIGDTVRISVAVVSARKIVACEYSIVANTERIVLEGNGKFVMSRLKVN